MTELPHRCVISGSLLLLGMGAVVMGQGDSSGAFLIGVGAFLVAWHVEVRK